MLFYIVIDAAFSTDCNSFTLKSTIDSFNDSTKTIDKEFGYGIEVYPNPVLNTLSIRLATEDILETVGVYTLM